MITLWWLLPYVEKLQFIHLDGKNTAFPQFQLVFRSLHTTPTQSYNLFQIIQCLGLVMPLSEISPNVRRHGSHPQAFRSPKKGLSSTQTTTSLAADAVQSMLRIATETGEIGPFSVRPSRVPRSGSRLQSIRRRSGSFDSAFPSGLPHQRPQPLRSKAQRNNGPRQVPSFSSLSRRDTIRSNLTSYHCNPRSRQRSSRPYYRGFEGMASPPPGPHGLYSHRSLVTLRSQRDFSSIGSHSPMTYRGSPRGPGHRAPSPAYSEASRYGYNIRPRYHRAASVGTVASSPASAYPRPGGMPGYLPHMNSSVTSFVRLPSPAVFFPHAGSGRSHFPSETNTPASISLNQHYGTGQGGSESIHGLHRSPTGSTVPQYYDYTESFAEENCFSSDFDVSTPSLPFNVDQTILENEPAPVFRRAQTPFGTLPGSAFLPSELPTKHNRTSSEQSKHSTAKPAADVPSRRSSLGFAAQIEAAGQKVSKKSTPDNVVIRSCTNQ